MGGTRKKIRRLGFACVCLNYALIVIFLSFSPITSVVAVSSSLETCHNNDDIDYAGTGTDTPTCEEYKTFTLSNPELAKDPIQGLIDWARAEGVFLSEKVEIRRQNPEDGESPYGMFARQDIPINETVLRIPTQVYLQLREDEIEMYGEEMETNSDSYFAEEMETYFANVCHLAKHLLDEIKVYRGKSSAESRSKYTAFIRYLEETQTKTNLPATYSEAGKSILRDIQGKWEGTRYIGANNYGKYVLPPWELVDWIDEGFVQSGCIDADDADARHAVALAIQRGYDTELIPIWDMVNHDNNNLNLNSNSLHSEEGLEVWAMTPIKAGDELYATYNFCTDCEDTGADWGTPGIFRDFGFVEEYPQLWPFLDQHVIVLVERNESTFQASYFASDKIYAPGKEEMSFFRDQLSRLKALRVDNLVENLTVPLEKYMIRQYYQSLVNAIAAIVDSEVDDPPRMFTKYP